jgi:hypothetical protein
MCDANLEVLDSWRRGSGGKNKKKEKKSFYYGFNAKVTVPTGRVAYSILLRFPGGSSGSFQVFNANIRNVYWEDEGVRLLIHSTWAPYNDLTDASSFTLIADHLNTAEIPGILYWPSRENKDSCFRSAIQTRSGGARTSVPFIAAGKGIDATQITRIKIGQNKIKKVGKIGKPLDEDQTIEISLPDY